MTTAELLLSLAATASSRAAAFGEDDSSVELAKAMLERVESLVQEIEGQRKDAEKHARELARVRTALADAIATYPDDGTTVLVSAERQEAWQAALDNT